MIPQVAPIALHIDGGSAVPAAYTVLRPIYGFHSAALRRGLGGLEGGMEKRHIMNDIDE